MTRVETVFDKEPEEIARQLREAADAIEAGLCTQYMTAEYGDSDDGPVHRVVGVEHMVVLDE